MNSKPLYVMIPTAARPELLERTLRSLAECDRPKVLRQVFVIENGACQGAREVAERLSDVLPIEYLFVDKANKSAALNAALEKVDDGLIFFADDDVRFDRRVLSAYVDAARKNPDCFFGGPFGVDYDKPPPEWLLRYLPGSAKGWSLANGEEMTRNKVFLGFNWAAFAGHLQALRGFDEQRGPGLPMTGQETEMQQRLLTHGYQAHYVPDAWVWHYVPEHRCSTEWAMERLIRNTRASQFMASRRLTSWGLLLQKIWWRMYFRRWLWKGAALIVPTDHIRFRARQWEARCRCALEVLRSLKPGQSS